LHSFGRTQPSFRHAGSATRRARFGFEQSWLQDDSVNRYLRSTATLDGEK
jgi:hypothetical protein